MVCKWFNWHQDLVATTFPREMVRSAQFFLICHKAGGHQSQAERCASLQPLVKRPGRWGKAEDISNVLYSCIPDWLPSHSSLIFCLTLLKFSYENLLRNTGSKFFISGVRHLKALLHENCRHLGHFLDLISFLLVVLEIISLSGSQMLSCVMTSQLLLKQITINFH